MLAVCLAFSQDISALAKDPKAKSKHTHSHQIEAKFKGHFLLISSHDSSCSCSSSGDLKPAVNPYTGQPYNFVFVNNQKYSSGNGTFELPYNMLLLAQNNSGPNDIIYVFEGNGTSTGMNAGIVLQDGQKLWGSGVHHKLDTTVGEVKIQSYSKGLPVITNSTGAAVVASSDTVISGVHLLANASVNGIVLGNIENCTIHKNIIDLVGSYVAFPPTAGVVLDGSTGKIDYEHNTINQTNGLSTGFLISSTLPSSKVLIKHNYFYATVGDGAQGIEIGTGEPLSAIGDFDYIKIEHNYLSGQGSSTQGLAIAGYGFNGTGHLVISNNLFDKQTEGVYPRPPTTVLVNLLTGANLLADVTNNIWQQTVNPSPYSSFQCSNGLLFGNPPPISVCLNLNNNVSDNTSSGAYVLANYAPECTYVADVGNNVGTVLEINTITPGSCP
jgi:hypothetical protein